MRRRGEGRAGCERGSVTAETAVLMPVIVLLLLAVACVGVLGAAQVRLDHAAGTAARELARNAGAEVDAARMAGPGASLARAETGGGVSVMLRRSVPLLGWFGPGVELRAEAFALVERTGGAAP